MGKRLSLNYTGLMLLLAAGVFVTYGLIVFLVQIGVFGQTGIANYIGQWYFATAVAVSISIGLMVYAFASAGRREKEAVRALDWLQELQGLLLSLQYPITAESLTAIGSHMASLIEEDSDWVMLVETPGLLMQGETHRRKHIRTQSHTGQDWPAEWAEGWLRQKMDDAAVYYLSNHVNLSPHETGYSWVLRSKGGDMAIGLSVKARGTSGGQPAFIQSAVEAGFDLILKRLSVMLIDIINRRGQLGAEGFGLLVRMLVHELSGEVQNVFNHAAQIPVEKPGSAVLLNQAEYRAVQAGLWRTSNWIQIMRDLPLLVDSFIPLMPEPTALHAVLTEVVTDATRAWPNVQFLVRGLKRDWRVNADIHLRSVLRNVIFNAASFSPDEEEVEISLHAKGRRVHISVIDHGPGIDPSYAEKVFDPYIPSEVRPNGHKGAGVGLSVARAIARAYGGDIVCYPREAERSKRKGGKFEIVLPLLTEELARS